jgi:DNA mismatch repair protein MSH5
MRFSYSLDARPVKEFDFESGRNKLINLRLGEDDGPIVQFIVPGDVVTETTNIDGIEQDTGRREHVLRMSGWINLESPLTVRLPHVFD